MEQEELHVDPQYASGYNDGYLLAKYDPTLAAQLVARPNDQNTYFKGLAGGKEQYDKEVLEWSRSFSRGAPAKDDREQHKDR